MAGVLCLSAESGQVSSWREWSVVASFGFKASVFHATIPDIRT
jgi:hypothetical protein